MAADISFQRDIVSIFQQHCVACHLTGKEPGQLALGPDKAYATLVGKASRESAYQLVQPGNADKSYLVMKLDGTHAQAGGQGVRMAFGAKPVSQAQRHMLRDWINAGAPRN